MTSNPLMPYVRAIALRLKGRGLAGFTLIETLLAILILTTAIAGPLSIAAKGLQLALIAKDQMTAVYLAQDAVEYVRFLRDSNKLSGQSDWLSGLDGVSNGHTTDQGGGQSDCTGANACIVDSLKDEVTYCGAASSGCPTSHLYFDPSDGTYTYSSTGNTQTIFVRTINITTPSSGGNSDEADMTVTVQWSDVGGITRSVVLRENLLDWQ